MKWTKSLLTFGFVLLGAAMAFAQAANPAAPDGPAIDTVATAIPGIVAEGAKIQVLGGEFKGTEGPVHLPDGSLVFTEGQAKRLTKIDVKTDEASTFVDNVTASGLGFDKNGRLYAVGPDGLAIVYPKGSEKILADKTLAPGLYQGNDLTIDDKGGVYYTILDAQVVMYVRPDGKVVKAAEKITRPNGITLSPDQKTLYVNDARGEYVLAFAVQPDGSLANRRDFAKYDRTDPVTDGTPFKLTSGADGLIVDNDGRLYVAGLNGVIVYSNKGQYLGKIVSSRRPQNIAFGGADGKTLYIVGREAVYKVRMLAQGLKSRPR